MSYKSGEIYFIRETTQEGYSDFVKVGLVASPRTSQQRLVEHQTGNPRKLALLESHIVETDLVSRVEAQLHSRFAKSRVGGEWFAFRSDAELEEAILHAKGLASEAKMIVPELISADNLSKVESNGVSIAANSTSIETGRKLAVAKAQKKLCDVEANKISQILVEAVERGEPVDSVSKTYKPKFDQKLFEAEHQLLADKYFLEEQAWSQRFLLKSKLDAEQKLEGSFLSELEEIRRQIESVSSPEKFSNLSAPSLWLTKLKALVLWDLDILEAQLKIECGDNEAIESVCNWKRGYSTKKVFDLKSFMVENTSLYLDYLTDEETKTYPIRDRGSKR